MTAMNVPADLARETEEFRERGFVVVRGAFRVEEMDVLRQAIENHAAMRAHAARAADLSRGATRPSFDSIFVWNDTSGFDLFAKATRSVKIIDRLEAYFGDEVYVYHNKIALKYPGVVGFSFHQDYAYWYDMGCLFPDMATVQIAVDPSTLANGCLRFIEGSHKMGRINHVFKDGVSDSMVDPERLEQARKIMPEVPVELERGDIAIFHANILHGSDDNHSDHSRIALLGCYNTRHNNPYKTVHGHPRYHRQEKVREAITMADVGNLPDFDYQWKE